MPDQVKSWNVVDADEVAKYFAEGYKLPDGQTLAGHEYYFDAAKGKFVFCLKINLEAKPNA